MMTKLVEDKEKELDDSTRPPNIPQKHPWLLITHGDGLERHTFYSISKNRYYTQNILEMCNKQVWTCSYGWLVLEDVKDVEQSCCLLNLVSMEKIQLPSLNFLDHCRCILTKPPTDLDCYILFALCSDSVAFCQVGYDEFVLQELQLDGQIGHLNDMIVFKGNIYGLMVVDGCQYTLVIADFVGKTLRLKSLIDNEIKMAPPITRCYVDFLVESFDELLTVREIFESPFNPEVIEIKVFRVDISRKIYIELKSIGDRAIFLSLKDGICCVASESGLRQNCVYFTRSCNQKLFLYDLEDRSQITSVPCSVIGSNLVYNSWLMMAYD